MINHELTWALFIIGGLLVFVSRAYVEKNQRDSDQCEHENIILQEQLNKEREARFDVYNKLLHLQDTIGDFKKEKVKQDSLKQKVIEKSTLLKK